MPDLLVTKITAMKPAEVMARAERFFTAQNWRVQSHNGSTAIFEWTTKLQLKQIVVATFLTLCLIVPGVIYYFLAIRDRRRQRSITVSLKPRGDRCEVLVNYPPGSSDLIIQFLADLV